jgi:hypothetical protein
VRTTVEVRLGSTDGPGAIPGPPSYTLLDSRGHFWLVFDNALPMIFAADGSFVASVGRIGQGPLEFRSPRIAMQAGDSVAIYDRIQGIVVVGPDGRPTRSIRQRDPAYLADAITLDWPGRVVMSGRGRNSDSFGWPLHLVDLSADSVRILRSFGLDSGAVAGTTSDQIRASARRLGGSSGGGFLAADRYLKFRIVRWSRDGALLSQIRRVSQLVPDGSDGMPGGPDLAPKPYVVDADEDASGSIWILARVPGTAWRKAWKDVSLPNVPTDMPAELLPAPTDLYDTLIEVIDPHEGTVVWRERMPGYGVQILRDHRVVMYRESAEGVPFIEILSVRLDASGPIRP